MIKNHPKKLINKLQSINAMKNSKDTLQVYDKYAKVYAEYTFPKLMQFQLNQFISMLPKQAKVLDVGCGSGRDAHYFHDYGLDVTAVDVSENMLKEAKSRVPDVVFKKMDMRKLTFPKESFDGIWIMATLSDVKKDEALTVLKEAARILKENGVLYVAVKEGKDEIIVNKPEYGNLPRFYALYQQPELENLLQQAGFTITSSIVSNDSYNDWVEIFAKLPS